jgi:hypothetical protein
MFGTNKTYNACHGSDAPDTAAQEINFFFGRAGSAAVGKCDQVSRAYAFWSLHPTPADASGWGFAQGFKHLRNDCVKHTVSKLFWCCKRRCNQSIFVL